MPKNNLLHKIIIWMVVVAGLVPIIYFASIEIGIAQATSNESAEPISDGAIGRYVENVAFGVGEKLSFDINYGFINAGTATMEVAKLIEYESRPCYQIVSRANSNSFFSTFYRVEDRLESIIDAIGLFSWRFEKNLQEGSYKSDRMFTFDQRNHKVHYKKDTLDIQQYTQDAFSALYFVRTQPLEIGDTLLIDNFTDGKFYSMQVIVHERETISVKAGTFDCIVVEPLLQAVGVFKNSGQLRVWLTDDRLRMPVLMKSKVIVGSISAELTDYQLGEIEAF